MVPMVVVLVAAEVVGEVAVQMLAVLGGAGGYGVGGVRANAGDAGAGGSSRRRGSFCTCCATLA